MRSKRNDWTARCSICLQLILAALVVVAGTSCAPKKSVEYRSLGVFPEHREIAQKLAGHYEQWRAVPYRIGGVGRSGVDCSAFVALTYRLQFGIDLPRTTEDLARTGKKIGVNDLQPGDLVLFKTGLVNRHVGIFLERGRFIHASTRQGVTLSALDDPYWRKRLWQARRVMH